MNLKSIQAAFVGCILFFCAFTAQAGPVNATANWTYNGANTDGGFRIEKKMPGSDEWEVEQDIQDIQTRSHSWTFEAVVGRTAFRLVAYSSTMESNPSNDMAFEYMEVQGLPAPTVILHFN